VDFKKNFVKMKVIYCFSGSAAMEFEINVAKLHGLFKGFKKQIFDEKSWKQENLQSDEEIIAIFAKDHKSSLPFKDVQVEQTLFLTCLINCQEVVSSEELDFEKPSILRPFVGLFDLKSLDTILELVKIRSDYLNQLQPINAKVTKNWWILLFEILPKLPNRVSSRILNRISEDNRRSILFMLACIKITQTGGSIPENVTFDNLDLTKLVFVVKELVSEPSADEVIKDIFEENVIVRKKVCSDFFFREKAEKAMQQKLLSLSLDDWINFTDMKSELLNPSSVIWWQPMEACPSNQQLLIAHFCFEIQESLDNSSCLRPVLANFARKYDKKFELDLDNLELNDILDQLEQDLEEWKLIAYLQHLMNNNLRDTLASQRARKVFEEKYSSHLVEYLSNILDQFKLEHTKLLMAILNSCHCEKVLKVLEMRLTNDTFKIEEMFDLEQNLRTFVNKAVDVQESLKEFLILVFQDPFKVVNSVLKEATDNAGKINLISELLVLLPMLDKFDIPDKLLDKLETATDHNSANMIINLSELSENLRTEFVLKLESWMTKSSDRLEKALDIINSVLDKSTINKDQINSWSRTLVLLDQLYTNRSSRSIEEGQIQTLVFEIQTKLTPNFVQKSELDLDENNQLFKLPWLKPYEWSKIDNIDDVIDAVIVLMELDTITEDHKKFILYNLSQGLLMKSDTMDEPLKVHDKICYLISKNLDVQSLQHCQVALMTRILETSEPDDFLHLVSVIANVPPCDSRTLSLTKLQMLLKLEE
jgi:hypothetical protein